MRGIARRRDEADRHFGEPCFAVEQPEREPLHAAGARGEKALELHEEPPGGEQQRLGLRHLRRQLEAGAELGRRGEERARIGHASERAVEVVEELPAEAARKPGPRQRGHVADARRADGRERFARGGVAGHDPHRQPGERAFEHGGIGDETLAPGVREPARTARGRRGGDERGEPHARAASAQASGDVLEAAEELQAAGDFERERSRGARARRSAYIARPSRQDRAGTRSLRPDCADGWRARVRARSPPRSRAPGARRVRPPSRRRRRCGDARRRPAAQAWQARASALRAAGSAGTALSIAA